LSALKESWRALQVRRASVHSDLPRLELPPVDTFTIVAPFRGACRMESRRKKGWKAAVFGVGDVGMTLPGKAVVLRWQLLVNHPMETVHIDLPMSAFTRHVDPGDLSRLDVLSTPDPVISSMATAVIRANEAGCDELYAESAAQFLVAHLLTPQALTTPETRRLSDHQLRTITEYMHAHLAERITLDDLAREVAMSRFHFLRLFSATTGLSPIQFLTELRIDTARRYLAASDEPIRLLGKRTGFASASHFAATFTRVVGCSPTSYRKRLRS
jgi:AraC family transcriptional regulator